MSRIGTTLSTFAMKSFLRQLRFLAVYGTLGILLTLIVGRGLYLVHGPALMPWHLAPLAAEFALQTRQKSNRWRTIARSSPA